MEASRRASIKIRRFLWKIIQKSIIRFAGARIMGNFTPVNSNNI